MDGDNVPELGARPTDIEVGVVPFGLLLLLSALLRARQGMLQAMAYLKDVLSRFTWNLNVFGMTLAGMILSPQFES